MTAPAIVLAAYVKNASLMDGTIRVVLDVEPKDRMALYAMCDKPGAAIVLTRITDDAALAADGETAANAVQGEEAPSVGAIPAESRPAVSSPVSGRLGARRRFALSNEAGMACDNPAFRDWLKNYSAIGEPLWDSAARRCVDIYGADAFDDKVIAKHVLYMHCGVNSRAGLVAGTVPGSLWSGLWADYEDWQRFGRAA